jgi:hypothetical protein
MGNIKVVLYLQKKGTTTKRIELSECHLLKDKMKGKVPT